MAILDVVTWPAKVLETRAENVKAFDDELKKLVKDMHDTMNSAAGIGLAANQVGVLKRVLVLNIPFLDPEEEQEESNRKELEKREWWHDKPMTFVNPEIVKSEGKCKGQEGCLSFPGIFDYVERKERVWVKALNEKGELFEAEASGLLSVCLQHEIDHLDGIVFINRMSRLKSNLIKKKILRQGSFENAEA